MIVTDLVRVDDVTPVFCHKAKAYRFPSKRSNFTARIGSEKDEVYLSSILYIVGHIAVVSTRLILITFPIVAKR